MKYGAVPLVALLAILTAGRAWADKSFRVERVQYAAVVASDGTANVTESITYRFDGKFTRANRTIPLRRGDHIYNVRVSEGGKEYTLSTSQIPGSYTVEERAQEVVITWYYRARDEERTFRVAYSASGWVTRYVDVAEYYQTLFSNETPGRIGEVSARVTLPGEIDPRELRAFAHGPLHGEVWIESGSVVTASVSSLPRGSAFDVRILMDSDAFASLPVAPEPMLDRILAEEREWAAEANRQREAAAARAERRRVERGLQERRARALLPVAIALGLAAFGVWIVLFRSHGSPHEVAVHTAPGDVPSDHPPAIVAYLMRRGVAGPALVATMVDLAERGHFSVTEITTTRTNWVGKSSHESDYRFLRTSSRDSSLRPYERSLAEFLVNDVGDGQSFTMSGLKEHARKRRTQTRKWFVQWTKDVKAAAESEDFFEPYPVFAMVGNAVLGVGVAAAGGVICAVTESPAGLPAIILGVVAAILTATLTRRTPEGRRLMLAWKAFRGHLESVSKAMGPVSLGSRDWARYLGAAILFGMHKKLVPHLRITDGQGAHVVPVWYSAASSSGVDGGLGGLAEGFSSMITSVSTTMSSSAGAGGGASTGGGAGGGGGSAGAG